MRTPEGQSLWHIGVKYNHLFMQICLSYQADLRYAISVNFCVEAYLKSGVTFLKRVTVTDSDDDGGYQGLFFNVEYTSWLWSVICSLLLVFHRYAKLKCILEENKHLFVMAPLYWDRIMPTKAVATSTAAIERSRGMRRRHASDD